MPNWCENRLVLRHDNPKMIKAAIEAFEDGKLLEFAVPMPSELRDEGVETYAGGEEGVKYEALRARNQAKYGYKSWYDWSIAKWGTKWDVSGDVEYQEANLARMNFDSAWSPPIGAYEALERQGFEVRALYYEPGVAFAGVFEDNAETTMDIDEALRSSWRYELDDAFGITEQQALMNEDD